MGVGQCGDNCPAVFEIVITTPIMYFRRQRGREGNFTGRSSRPEQSRVLLRHAEEGLGAAVRAHVTTDDTREPADTHLQPPFLDLQIHI